jgi:hypothetical protein
MAAVVKIRSVEFREAVPVGGSMRQRVSVEAGIAASIADVGVVVADGDAFTLVPWANVRWVVAEEGEG